MRSGLPRDPPRARPAPLLRPNAGERARASASVAWQPAQGGGGAPGASPPYLAANSSSSLTLTGGGVPIVPPRTGAALLSHSSTKRNVLLDSRSVSFMCLLSIALAPLSRTHDGSVIVLGNDWPFAPYTCAVIPGVEVMTFSEPSLRALLRSITRPSAILGATLGSTAAVHAVELSPSIARRGSPNRSAGYE